MMSIIGYNAFAIIILAILYIALKRIHNNRQKNIVWLIIKIVIIILIIRMLIAMLLLNTIAFGVIAS